MNYDHIIIEHIDRIIRESVDTMGKIIRLRKNDIERLLREPGSGCLIYGLQKEMKKDYAYVSKINRIRRTTNPYEQLEHIQELYKLQLFDAIYYESKGCVWKRFT
mgnify:CR=1 FL=1|tara:strand:- start:513 stop:827 length:315 start_codon:yes stop_codon:yes gene_type:complete